MKRRHQILILISLMLALFRLPSCKNTRPPSESERTAITSVFKAFELAQERKPEDRLSASIRIKGQGAYVRYATQNNPPTKRPIVITLRLTNQNGNWIVAESRTK